MHELEVKFFVPDLQVFARMLEGTSAQQTDPRVHEFNLRFDTPAGDLSRAYRALRLRQDRAVRLTYKGPSVDSDGARLREEIEVKVEDFAKARRFLEVLGYQIWVIYEKYRTSYTMGINRDRVVRKSQSGEDERVLVVLDELPFGNFVEIEGPTGKDLRTAAALLDLDWEAQVRESYLELFQTLQKKLNLRFRDLTFENFKGLSITSEELGVQAAWGHKSSF
jgi:adenylate cyclase class 2